MSARISQITKVVEKSWKEDEMYDVLWLLPHESGIKEAAIWVGFSKFLPKECIVLVSGEPRGISLESSFVITVPEFEFDPTVVPQWVTAEIIDSIISWLSANQTLLDSVASESYKEEYAETDYYSLVVKI